MRIDVSAISGLLRQPSIHRQAWPRTRPVGTEPSLHRVLKNRPERRSQRTKCSTTSLADHLSLPWQSWMFHRPHLMPWPAGIGDTAGVVVHDHPESPQLVLDGYAFDYPAAACCANPLEAPESEVWYRANGYRFLLREMCHGGRAQLGGCLDGLMILRRRSAARGRQRCFARPVVSPPTNHRATLANDPSQGRSNPESESAVRSVNCRRSQLNEAEAQTAGFDRAHDWPSVFRDRSRRRCSTLLADVKGRAELANRLASVYAASSCPLDSMPRVFHNPLFTSADSAARRDLGRGVTLQLAVLSQRTTSTAAESLAGPPSSDQLSLDSEVVDGG